MAKYTRTNVYTNGGSFKNKTLFWYALGVKALNELALDDKLSWRFYAAIHGFREDLWRTYGYLRAGDRVPPAAVTGLYWEQCQHGSWYFLPWHRGYLLGIEATLRDAIVRHGGPSDWAMPYWNYFVKHENQLPPAFASKTLPPGSSQNSFLPDGSHNPLFIEQRWGPDRATPGNVFVPLDQVDLNALAKRDFTGVTSGGDPGFGGPDTGFSRMNSPHGALESNPHDVVHSSVGGRNPADPGRLGGLMSASLTAGLDPIFWLHHANIDRLWEVWLRRPTSRGNPTERKWRSGPQPPERTFIVPLPGGKEWKFTPADVDDLARLDYTYDDFTTAGATPRMLDQMERVSATFARKASTEETAMAASKNVELVGASHHGLRIVGAAPVHASVALDGAVRRKVVRSMRAEGAAAEPERVFLNLENVRGLSDATILQVYVNLPENADPSSHPERRAGTIGLFGVSEATTSEEHGQAGLTYVLEITHMVNALDLDTNALDVRIVPFDDVPEEAEISVGRVSVFRQGS
ncbi:MAG TPA: tyrosinase family protein [Thermoanaerobaculia bacterium]|nr:tyrosinase family protein [Thermoanaerobaculia bacterium]